ncbi:MAG: hypothetical protein ACLQDV_13105 [Candidatus Binataceae bacterium]
MQVRSARTIWLVHPNEAEAAAREAQLAAMGYRVVRRRWSSPEITRAKATPPVAVIVDLSRTPSVGRDAAIAMRSHRALLSVPFVLVGGSPDAVAGVRKFLPDAVESDWPRMAATIRGALKQRPSGARLLSVFSAYEDTPLPKKLGIKAGGAVAVLKAPRGLRATLGELPDGARISRHGNRPRDLTLWFVHSARELRSELAFMIEYAASGGLWIFWQKTPPGDDPGRLTQPIVRKAGLDSGLVDFKVTRFDDDWAGLRFTKRK